MYIYMCDDIAKADMVSWFRCLGGRNEAFRSTLFLELRMHVCIYVHYVWPMSCRCQERWQVIIEVMIWQVPYESAMFLCRQLTWAGWKIHI